MDLNKPNKQVQLVSTNTNDTKALRNSINIKKESDMRKLPWNIILAGLFITGCAPMCGENRKEMSAERVVEAYLDIALNMNSLSQKDDLIAFTTGNLKASIAGANDKVFRDAYIERQYDLQKYSLIERRDRTPRETEITYELTYKEIDGTTKSEDAAIVTTENTVAVVREKGSWYIHDVLGNKTSIEFPVTDMNSIHVKVSK